jgi:hypothetical protein
MINDRNASYNQQVAREKYRNISGIYIKLDINCKMVAELIKKGGVIFE